MRAFISYTRSKDNYDAVSKFKEFFKSELTLYVPEAQVFQDRDEIGVGDVFPELLETKLEQCDLLIPLLSPAWFQSDWCRREYDTFIKKEQSLGIDNPRIFPLLWVKTKELDDPVTDPIAKALKDIIYKDFRNFRTLDINDSKYAGEVATLAEKAQEIASRQ